MSEDDRGLPARQDDSTILRARLAEARCRIRKLRALSRGVRFAVLAHLILGPWLLFRALVPLPLGLYLLALLLVTFSGVAYGLLAPLPSSLVARLLDYRLALKERLGSALEVMDRRGHPMVDALLQDAAAAAQGARLDSAIPIVTPAEARFLLPALALVAALFLLPPLPLRSLGSTGLSASRGAQQNQDPAAPLVETGRPDSRSLESLKEPRERKGRESAGLDQLAARQAWGELAATFKDTAIAPKRPDFATFLKGGDERLRLLAPSTSFPDLQADYTQSPDQVQIRRMQDTLRGARLGKPSTAELERLMEELRSLDRRHEQRGLSDGERALGRFAGKDGGPSAGLLQALERALSRLRERSADRDEGGQGLKPAPEAASGAGGQEEDTGDLPDGARREGQERGSRPGRVPSRQVRDRPTPRIDAGKLDSALSGQAREGEQESYDTNLAGAGVKSPSRLPYMALLTQYRQMAEEALSKERVPFNYREQVKEYFKSLEQ